MRVLVDVVRKPAVPVSSILPDASAAIDEAFLWALSKNREERPASVEQWVSVFADELKYMPSRACGWCGSDGLGGISALLDGRER